MITSSKIKAFFFKKRSEKSEYLDKIYTFLITSKSIWTSQAGYISIELRLKDIIYIIKALMFSSNAALVNFFLSIISTYLIVGRALAVV